MTPVGNATRPLADTLDLHLWERPEQRDGLREQLFATGKVRDLEFRVRRKDGQVFTALRSADLIEVDGGYALYSSPPISLSQDGKRLLLELVDN